MAEALRAGAALERVAIEDDLTSWTAVRGESSGASARAAAAIDQGASPPDLAHPSRGRPSLFFGSELENTDLRLRRRLERGRYGQARRIRATSRGGDARSRLAYLWQTSFTEMHVLPQVLPFLQLLK